MKKIVLLCLAVVFLFSSEYRYRKYTHVKDFLKPLVQKTIEQGEKYRVPPAAILAIASVESGYGRGYIASISGNILSLGANKGEKMLPALYLPNVKDPYKIIYNPKEIAKYKTSELRYKKRAKSLKKDYRPSPFAGTSNNLEYFDENPKAKVQANISCIEDFSRVWISESYRYEPFKKARIDLKKRVAEGGKSSLYLQVTAEELIDNIGGKAHSFNYRKTWPKKVKTVMKNIGLVELIQDMKSGLSFEEAWNK